MNGLQSAFWIFGTLKKGLLHVSVYNTISEEVNDKLRNLSRPGCAPVWRTRRAIQGLGSH
jgi:hypothetical protein